MSSCAKWQPAQALTTSHILLSDFFPSRTPSDVAVVGARLSIEGHPPRASSSFSVGGATLRRWRCVPSMTTVSRNYGAAPSRVRPVEVPRENAWRQSEREISASLLIVFMFAVPLWMIIMSNGEKSRQQEALLERLNVLGIEVNEGGEAKNNH